MRRRPQRRSGTSVWGTGTSSGRGEWQAAGEGLEGVAVRESLDGLDGFRGGGLGGEEEEVHALDFAIRRVEPGDEVAPAGGVLAEAEGAVAVLGELEVVGVVAGEE